MNKAELQNEKTRLRVITLSSTDTPERIRNFELLIQSLDGYEVLVSQDENKGYVIDINILT